MRLAFDQERAQPQLPREERYPNDVTDFERAAIAGS